MHSWSRTRRALVALGVTGSVLLAGLIGWWLSPDDDASESGPLLRTRSTADGSGLLRVIDDPDLGARGDVTGLAPGISRTLVVRLANDGDRPVRLLSLVGTPSDASPDCTTANIQVDRYDASASGAKAYVLAPDSSTDVPLTATMPETGVNQDACKDNRFPIAYAIEAEAAS